MNPENINKAKELLKTHENLTDIISVLLYTADTIAINVISTYGTGHQAYIKPSETLLTKIRKVLQDEQQFITEQIEKL